MQEREVKAKHQQLVSGVRLFSLKVFALVLSRLSELAVLMLFIFDPFLGVHTVILGFHIFLGLHQLLISFIFCNLPLLHIRYILGLYAITL